MVELLLQCVYGRQKTLQDWPDRLEVGVRNREVLVAKDRRKRWLGEPLGQRRLRVRSPAHVLSARRRWPVEIPDGPRPHIEVAGCLLDHARDRCPRRAFAAVVGRDQRQRGGVSPLVPFLEGKGQNGPREHLQQLAVVRGRHRGVFFPKRLHKAPDEVRAYRFDTEEQPGEVEPVSNRLFLSYSVTRLD